MAVYHRIFNHYCVFDVMTTIAYKDGIMACDSCYSGNDYVWLRQDKIYRLRSGALLGLAGSFEDRALVARLQDVKDGEGIPGPKELKEIAPAINGLMVFPSGELYAFEIGDKTEDETVVFKVESKSFACGSGSKPAMVALYLGKSAEEAVEIACMFDIHSQPPIFSHKLVE